MPSQALCIRDTSKRQFLRIGENPLNFTIKQAQLSKQRFTTVGGSVCTKFSIIARIRLTTWRLFEPQLRISLKARYTKSSQFGVRKITRSCPD